MKTYDNLFDFRRDLMTASAPSPLNDLKMNVILYGSLNSIEDFLISVYRDRAEVGASLLAAVAGALAIFERDRFLTIGQDGTARKMRLALLRDAGEEAPERLGWPDPSEDPTWPDPAQDAD